MDLDLDADQRAVRDALAQLLDQRADIERARALAEAGTGYDAELADALREGGYDAIALDPEAGPLEAALLVEQVARRAGCVPIAAEALVAPLVTGAASAGPVALVDASRDTPVRFAPIARTLLVVDGEIARCVQLAEGDVETVPSNFGFPMGRVSASALRGGDELPDTGAERVRAWWRVALAAEMVGAMAGALDDTVAYLKERRQFGRAIGSFQAVQHRLAECAVQLEGARWLALEAAAKGAPGQAACTAAGYAASAALRVFRDTHQLSGAIGFTREHDLHLWSMRLQALRLELGGAPAHYRALAAERWAGAA